MSNMKERTGWRDAALSARHKYWGDNCPALDLDFLLIEYDTAKACALIEYKHEWAKPQDPGHNSYRAMADLGDRAGVPVFACRYASDFSWWIGIPLNNLALEYLSERTKMAEREWITLLYKLRGYEVEFDSKGWPSRKKNHV